MCTHTHTHTHTYTHTHTHTNGIATYVPHGPVPRCALVIICKLLSTTTLQLRVWFGSHCLRINLIAVSLLYSQPPTKVNKVGLEPPEDLKPLKPMITTTKGGFTDMLVLTPIV